MVKPAKDNSEQEQEREIVRALIALQSESPIRNHSSYPLSILWNMFQHIEGNGLFEREITIKDEKIEEIFTRNFKFFLDNYPEVMDITAKGATMYKTKPIDYTGCDPIIAEHLKRGKRIYCGDDDGNDFYVIGFECYDSHPYISDFGRHKLGTVTPFELTAYVKKASEIVKWLEDNGYLVDQRGNWTHEEKPAVYASVFFMCSKELAVDAEHIHEEWLEYR